MGTTQRDKLVAARQTEILLALREKYLAAWNAGKSMDHCSTGIPLTTLGNDGITRSALIFLKCRRFVRITTDGVVYFDKMGFHEAFRIVESREKLEAKSKGASNSRLSIIEKAVKS